MNKKKIVYKIPKGCKPYKFQIENQRMIDKFNFRSLLSDPMGSGKTFVTAWAFWRWLQEGKIDKAIVVCPAHMKWHWKKELKRFGLRSVVLETRTPPKKETFPNIDAFIINYDILPWWVDWFDRNIWYQLVIVDECQAICNPDIKRTKAIVELIHEEVPYCIGISGTPLTHRPGELFTILHILRPDLYPSRFAFGSAYCNPTKGRGNHWEYKGATNLPHLHYMLKKNLMIRHKLEEILPDLPKETRIVIPMTVDLTEYKYAEENYLDWLRTYNPKRFKKGSAQYAEALTKTGDLIRLIGRLKMKDIINWIDDFLYDGDDKMVVFGQHKAVIREGFGKYYGEKCEVVDGQVVGEHRQQAFDRFNNDPKCRLLFGNLRAAGTGWPSVSPIICFAEYAWNPGIHRQAECRGRGINRGGNRNALYYWLVAEGTIEEELIELLQSKQRTLSAVLDGDKNYDSMDVFNEFLEKLQARMK